MADGRRAKFDAEAVVHLPSIYAAACRLTRDVEQARDLTQDAMLRAYRAFDTFKAGTSARAWLLTVLYSVFVNQYRRQQRQLTTESIDVLQAESGYEPASATDPLPDPWQPAGWSEPQVMTALDALPDEFRAAVLLVDVEELSYEEAAAAMNCVVGTVRSRVYRGRRLLAASLAHLARQGRVASR